MSGMPDARSFIRIFLIFLVQSVLSFLFPEQAPPLLLIAVIFQAFLGGPACGFVTGCWAGIFLEWFFPGRMGAQMVSYAAAGFLAGLASSKIFRENLLMRIGVPMAAAYGVSLLGSLGRGETITGLLGHAFWLSRPIETALAGLVLYRFFRPRPDRLGAR